MNLPPNAVELNSQFVWPYSRHYEGDSIEDMGIKIGTIDPNGTQTPLACAAMMNLRTMTTDQPPEIWNGDSNEPVTARLTSPDGRRTVILRGKPTKEEWIGAAFVLLGPMPTPPTLEIGDGLIPTVTTIGDLGQDFPKINMDPAVVARIGAQAQMFATQGDMWNHQVDAVKETILAAMEQHKE